MSSNTMTSDMASQKLSKIYNMMSKLAIDKAQNIETTATTSTPSLPEKHQNQVAQKGRKIFIKPVEPVKKLDSNYIRVSSTRKQKSAINFSV